jgi:hypothetical protein
MATAAWLALPYAAVGVPRPSRAVTLAPSVADHRRSRATLPRGGGCSPRRTPPSGRVGPDTYRGAGRRVRAPLFGPTDPKILRVAPSGELLLPDAGPVAVAGLSLREAQSRVREVLRPYVRGKGFVLALHRTRRFRLPVLGDVNRPGVVTLQAPVRASEAIEAAGGVAPLGALRGIEGAAPTRPGRPCAHARGDPERKPSRVRDRCDLRACRRRSRSQGAVPHGGAPDFVEEIV